MLIQMILAKSKKVFIFFYLYNIYSSSFLNYGILSKKNKKFNGLSR